MRAYTKEFRRDAVSVYRKGGRSIRQLAADLGVNHWTLRDWVDGEMKGRKTRQPAPQPPSHETLEEKVKRLERENRDLRKKNAQLETDRAILKKAAAFFAKESE